MFENSELVERFLDYWRITGHQRIGFLYGRYEIHPDIPLGIRAVVAAIYEPPQVIKITVYKFNILDIKFNFFYIKIIVNC
jgi:hypothetical protein